MQQIHYIYKGEVTKKIAYVLDLLKRRLQNTGIKLVNHGETPGELFLLLVCNDLCSDSQAFSVFWKPDADKSKLYNSQFTYSEDEKAVDIKLFDDYSSHSSVIAEGPAGLLYGVIEFCERCEVRKMLPPRPFEISRSPALEYRSNCLLLMKVGRYDVDITKTEFPWFYDKKWWVCYLDFLTDNRYNMLTLWNYHPFPYFVKVTGYEEASPIEPKQREENRELFAWLCEEVEKRSISIVFHFYNIYVTHKYAQILGMSGIHKFSQDQAPYVYEYSRANIRSFSEVFPKVWLMGCFGEGVPGGEAEKFAAEVVVDALIEAGSKTPLIVRQWSSLTTQNVKKYLLGKYEKMYVMIKHNAEHIASEVPDSRIRDWISLELPCFVNMHMISEAGPFRWSPYRFIRQTCLIYQALGLKGIHVYPHWSWRTPYVGDKDSTLPETDRDYLYHAAWGRYSFDGIRDDDEEKRHWTRMLNKFFGSRTISEAIIESQERAGRALVRLQQHLWIHYDNHSIISAGFLLKQYLIAKSVHGMFIIKTDIQEDILPLAAELTGDIAAVEGDYTITECIAKSLEDINDAIKILDSAGILPDFSEAGRYRSDAEAIKLVLLHHLNKIKALSFLVEFIRSEKIENINKGMQMLRNSLDYYVELTELTSKTYVGISDVNPIYPIRIDKSRMPYHWVDLLPVFQEEFSEVERIASEAGSGKIKMAAESVKVYLGIV